MNYVPLKNSSWSKYELLKVSLQQEARHLEWMYIYEHGQRPFVQFNSPALLESSSNILIDFLIAGAIACSCVIMALLHTSSWKPSPYTVSYYIMLLVQNFVSIHPPFSATSCQDGVPLNEGDSGLFGAGGSEKGLESLAERTAGSIIVLHCLILDLTSHSFISFLLQLFDS